MRLLAAITLVLLLTNHATSAAGSDLSQQFDAANRLYEQGKFSDAAAAYERLLQGGDVSASLYFNWGNAQFKAGRIGRALAAYRQAEDLAARDPDLRANLRFAREQVQGPALRPGGRERLLAAFSLNEWSAFTAGALWGWFGLLALRQFRPALKRPLRNLTLAFALLTILLGAGLGLNLRARLAEQTAIVIAADVAVRSGPFDESPTAFMTHDGAELRVVDQKDDWLQVSAGARRSGWLSRKHVIPVPAR